MANYRINNSSSIKVSPSRPSYHFPILIEKSTRHSNRQTGSGQHLVAKYVTNPELQGHPPNREVSIESRHKRCSPTFLFNRKRTRPGQHLVAKNITNTALRTPAHLGKVDQKSTQKCNPTFLFNQEQARMGQHLVAKYVTTAEPHERPIGDCRSKNQHRGAL